MCGIIGYIGEKDKAVNSIYAGLKKLEYRGYDSCGAAFSDGIDIESFFYLGAPSKISEIPSLDSMCGIGHTRWATHGKVTLDNAHPHR